MTSVRAGTGSRLPLSTVPDMFGGRMAGAVLVAVAACTWGTATGFGTAFGATSSSSVTLTPAQAAAALLAPTDMPAGWTTVTPQVTQPAATGGMCNGPNRLGRVQAAGGTELAEAGYLQTPQQGPLIGETIATFPTARKAQSLLDATARAVRACATGYDAGNPQVAGGTLHLGESTLHVHKAGDQTVAYREVTTPHFQGRTGASTTDDIVLVRKGNTVISVNRLGTGTDPAQLQTYVRAAATKLTAALLPSRA